MALDWGALETEFNSYKDYAPTGVYKAKIATVENRTSSTGTIWQEFKFEDSDQYAFPKVSHPLSPKNANWRAWHWKQLFVFLGATEDGAKKNVEACEGKADYEKIAAAYLSSMERLVAKHPEVEIETWPDGKYMRADFNDRVRMSNPDDDRPESKASDDPFEGSEDVTEEETGDIPF